MELGEHTYTFAARMRKIWILRCVDLPRDISKHIREAAGVKAQHIPVRGWIEGLAMQSTLMPAGGGRYRLHVHSRIWRKLKIDAGATVDVALAIEHERRETPVPADLAAALADEPRALAEFHRVTAAYRRQTIIFLENAKQAKTREKRLKRIVRHMLMRALKKQKRPQKKSVQATRPARAKCQRVRE
jgi:bacteriocin resistance YdeI/OmpD-like protein/uncharacterized protein DUF1905